MWKKAKAKQKAKQTNTFHFKNNDDAINNNNKQQQEQAQAHKHIHKNDPVATNDSLVPMTIPASRSMIRHQTSLFRSLMYRSYHTSPVAFTNTKLIINAVGVDRLGIVSDMTKHVIDVGGNVGESQASKLGQHFSLMMLVDVPDDKLTTLNDSLASMTDLSASVYHVKEGGADDTASSSSAVGYRGKLTLEGADNQGIVHKVCKILSNNGLNIARMETSDELAPEGSTVLFKMNSEAIAYSPLSSGFDVTKIKNELSELGDDLNCDIVLEDMKV